MNAGPDFSSDTEKSQENRKWRNFYKEVKAAVKSANDPVLKFISGGGLGLGLEKTQKSSFSVITICSNLRVR